MLNTVRECSHCGAHVMTEGNFCPRCGHPLDSDPTPVSAGPDTGPLPPTLPEADHPVPDVFIPPGEHDMGAAGDELQAVRIPVLDKHDRPESVTGPDDGTPDATLPAIETADPGADAVNPATSDVVLPVLAPAPEQQDAVDENGTADVAAAEDAEDAPPPEDHADLPTTRFNPVEPVEGADATGDEPTAPDTDDAEGGPEQDETGEFATGDFSESAEATPEIVEPPAVQETMPETPTAPDEAMPEDTGAERAPLPHPWLAELSEDAEIHPPQIEERPANVADTMPRLTGDMIQATDEFDTASWHGGSAGADVTSPVVVRSAPEPTTAVPPAPYTPPPMPVAAPPTIIAPPAPYYAPSPYAPGIAPSPAAGFMQQRVQLYQRDGYHMVSHAPHEVVLSRGKHIGVGGWLLALVSISGALWYLLILLLSGFQRDRVYISLEGDGYVYEDGPGAAHVRRQRARGGRRWGVVGLIIFVLAFLLTAGLAITAAVTVSQDRYQAALREAYPAITLFEERFTAAEADPADVDLMNNGFVAWTVAAVIAGVGVWGGLTLIVVGTIHATAYRVNVPSLPGAG